MIQVPDIEGLTGKIEDILKSGWLTTGLWNKKFEAQTAEMAGTDYAVSVANATLGLELVLRCLPTKGFVVIPTNTHFATAVAVINAGHELLLADVSPDTMMLDLNTVKEAYLAGTRASQKPLVAVINVSIGGWLSEDLLDIQEWCMEKGAALIEDAAHAHGSMLEDKLAGSFGLAGVFSYFPTKVAFGGSGGCITTDDEVLSFKLRKLAWFGRAELTLDDNFENIGTNAQMNNIDACICHHTQAYLSNFIQQRARVAKVYDEVLDQAGSDKVKALSCVTCTPNGYKYILKGKEVDRIKEIFADEGEPVQMSVFDRPLHSQKALLDSPLWLNKSGYFTNAEDVCVNHICLPIGTDFHKKELDKVQMVLRKSLGAIR